MVWNKTQARNKYKLQRYITMYIIYATAYEIYGSMAPYEPASESSKIVTILIYHKKHTHTHTRHVIWQGVSSSARVFLAIANHQNHQNHVCWFPGNFSCLIYSHDMTYCRVNRKPLLFFLNITILLVCSFIFNHCIVEIFRFFVSLSHVGKSLPVLIE